MAQKRQKHTDQEWLGLIRECMASAQPVRSWCEQHNMTTKAFYYHTRQLRQKGYPVPQRNSGSSQQERQEIVSLAIPDAGPTRRREQETCMADAALHIQLRGIHIEVTNHAGQELIQNTLHALLELC